MLLVLTDVNDDDMLRQAHVLHQHTIHVQKAKSPCLFNTLLIQLMKKSRQSAQALQEERELVHRSTQLRARNAWSFVAAAVIALVALGSLITALVFMLSLPSHPTCVDPKLTTNENLKLQVRVLASTKTPQAVNQCLTAVPSTAGLDDFVTTGALTLQPCDADDSRQQWLVNEMAVAGSVPSGAASESGASQQQDGIQTALFSLSNASGAAELGATGPWRLVTPCARRGVDLACLDPSKPCPVTLSNSSGFARFAPCLNENVDPSTNAVAAVATTHQAPYALATQGSSEPYFLFNNRTRDNWCGFHVADVSANAIRNLNGLGYDETQQRVVWTVPDLVLGFVRAQ